MNRFFAELKRRRVPQTALWYVGTSVAVVEAGNVFLPTLGAPAGSVRLLTILALFGLPVAITLAWAFDVSSSARRAWTGLVLVGVVSAISLLGAFAMWQRSSAREVAATDATSFTTDPAHVAVLPFTTSGDHDLDAFADNLQMRLIDGLSVASSHATTGAKRLRVVSQASILPFSQGTVSLDSIARVLKVGTVLNGTVEHVGDTMRVLVRLVDAQSGDQLATKTAQVRGNDRVALLDAVADSVIRLIRTELGPLVKTRMQLLETRNPDAFERVTLAAQRVDDFDAALARNDFVGADRVLNDMDALYAEAERFDPKWVEPIVERGRLYRKRLRLARARRDQGIGALIDGGIKQTDRALKVHPGDYRALELRGDLEELRLRVARPPNDADASRLADEAERDLRAALVGNPTPARTLRILSELSAQTGKTQQALEYGKRAYDEDPYLDQVEMTMFRLFEYSFALDNDSEAAKWCKEGGARFSIEVFMDCRLSLAAWSDNYPLKPDSAWALAKSELAAMPEALRPMLAGHLASVVAAILVRARLPDSALSVVRGARQVSKDASVAIPAAGVYSLLNMPDSSFNILRDLVTNNPGMKGSLNRSVALRMLRSDPRFAQLSGESPARP